MADKLKHIKYKQGMTNVWSDGEKVIITNYTGDKHVKTNIEQIFGVGEFDKLQLTCYSEGKDKSGRKYEMVTGYVPERVLKDLNINENLTKKYFK